MISGLEVVMAFGIATLFGTVTYFVFKAANRKNVRDSLRDAARVQADNRVIYRTSGSQLPVSFHFWVHIAARKLTKLLIGLTVPHAKEVILKELKARNIRKDDPDHVWTRDSAHDFAAEYVSTYGEPYGSIRLRGSNQ